MGIHNKAAKQRIAFSSANWTRFAGAATASPTIADLMTCPVIHMSGSTGMTATLPAASASGLEGMLAMCVGAGTGAMTVAAAGTYGGLAATTTLTVAQGSLAFVMMGPGDTAGAGQYWYAPTIGVTQS